MSDTMLGFELLRHDPVLLCVIQRRVGIGEVGSLATPRAIPIKTIRLREIEPISPNIPPALSSLHEASAEREVTISESAEATPEPFFVHVSPGGLSSRRLLSESASPSSSTAVRRDRLRFIAPRWFIPDEPELNDPRTDRYTLSHISPAVIPLAFSEGLDERVVKLLRQI